MKTVNEAFQILHEDELIILTPVRNLREFDFAKTDGAASPVFKLLQEKRAKHLVLDLSRTDYYGSTALGFFVNLRKHVVEQGGQMAICNISKHELQVLRISKLDKLWPICDSLEAAIEAVRAESQGSENSNT